MREHWTLDPDLRYLNHGSFGAVPVVTQQAQRRLQEAAEANPMRWFRDLPGRLVSTRETIGDYLGVPGRDIALVANATTGVNVALRSLTTAPGQRIVMTNHRYTGVALAAARVAAERGCELVVVDVGLAADDDAVVSGLAAAVDSSTVCIIIDQITSLTAKLMPVERVVALGRSHGVPVIVDGAHAPALVDNPVVGDYWTGNLHKWPCAPRGSGVLHVAASRQGSVVPSVVALSDPLGFPEAFDFPGTTDSTGWLAAPTSLDLLETLGFADRRKDLGVLVETGAESIAEAVGGVVANVGTPAPTMRLVTLPDGLVTDELSGARLGAFLASRSSAEVAVTSWGTHGFLRLSAHLYNALDDYTVTASRFAPLFADPAALHAVARGFATVVT